jgi:hypothetical protein
MQRADGGRCDFGADEASALTRAGADEGVLPYMGCYGSPNA